MFLYPVIFQGDTKYFKRLTSGSKSEVDIGGFWCFGTVVFIEFVLYGDTVLYMFF